MKLPFYPTPTASHARGRHPSATGAQTWSAVGMLVAAVGLSCAGFIVPPLGEISDSVLWLFAQCLLYAGSILGVSTYVDGKISEMRLSAMPPDSPRHVSSTDNDGQGGPPGTSVTPDLAETGHPDEDAPRRTGDSCDKQRNNGPRTAPRTAFRSRPVETT